MMQNSPPDGRAGVDAALVRRLLAAQFPEWADLPIRPAEQEGWDNRTYRLGADMSVRMPTGEGYAASVAKEQRWLPVLAPQVPLPIPEPLGKGVPGEGYAYPWSVYRWLDGEPASVDKIGDLPRLATDLAAFLIALQGADATDGPLAGAHSAYRGASVATYDDETRRAIALLDGKIDATLATEGWEAALAATWTGAPVWFHGDVALGNLLIRDGELAAVIDFGTSGVGDPASDLAITWTTFAGASREAFRNAMPADEAMWARARGWALWKALKVYSGIDDNQATAAASVRVVDEVLAEHRRLSS